jgi:hypothetical protein
MVVKSLMIASAGIFLVLGLIHVAYIFWGLQFTPRDPGLQATMSQISPVLTAETSMWKAWVGFNASHSMGLILFGLVYGYLAIMHGEILFKSPFLLLVGLAMVGGIVVLAKLYWFSTAFWSTCAALVCYLTSIAVSRG